MQLSPCHYREPIESSLTLRCHHPQVHARRGVVSADICQACRFAVPGERRVVATAEAVHVAKPSVEVLSTSQGGRVVNGRVVAPPIGRANYRCDVVIPYRHGLQWLPQAIESILTQLSVDCRLHLINDASSEDDLWVRRRYARLDNLFWYRNSDCRGPYRSLHGVWRNIRFPFFAIQDADDISLPTRLWCAIHALETMNCDIYGGAMEQFVDWEMGRDPSHRDYVDQRPSIVSGRPNVVPEGNVINGTMVCRTTMFQRLNGFADFHRGADTEFIVRAHLAGARMFFDDRVVALRRVHDKGLSCGARTQAPDAVRSQVYEQIGRLRALARNDPTKVDWHEFGSLAQQCADGRTLSLARPTHGQHQPPSGATRWLTPISSACSGWDYLNREGFVGANSRQIPAILNLGTVQNYDSFVAALGKNVRRDARLAAKQGFRCRMFVPENHAPDMLEIARSKTHRQGAPMRETVSSLFAPSELVPQQERELLPIEKPANYTRFFGVFEPRPGYRQGSLEVNEKLVAFIQLTRKGNLAFYTKILGHADYLRHGVMFAAHLHVLQWLLQRRDLAVRDIELLMYSGWDGRSPGMHLWKQRAGFRPACLYLSSAAASLPPERGPAVFPQEVLEGARSAAAFFCAAFGGANDVVHYRQANLHDVCLVDQDFNKLSAMRQSYPSSWNYLLTDAFVAAEEMRRQRTFDVVSCDQWSSQFELVADRHFSTFHALARNYLLITVVPAWADAKGHSPDWFRDNDLDYPLYRDVRDAFAHRPTTTSRLSEIFTARQRVPIAVIDVVKRTNYLGGCYWIVIKK